MYCTRESAASYDIQFTNSGGDGKRTVKALDILPLFSPTAALATALLTNIAASVRIPGKVFKMYMKTHT
jgi:hypothetical protein